MTMSHQKTDGWYVSARRRNHLYRYAPDRIFVFPLGKDGAIGTAWEMHSELPGCLVPLDLTKYPILQDAENAIHCLTLKAGYTLPAAVRYVNRQRLYNKIFEWPSLCTTPCSPQPSVLSPDKASWFTRLRDRWIKPVNYVKDPLA